MPGPFTQFGMKTGHVDIIDWDKAIIIGFGAQWDITKNEWYLPISPLYVETPDGPREITKARVVYKRPEPTQIEFDLPEIAVNRDDILPATSRQQSTTMQYRLPAESAVPVSVNGDIGWTTYETKDQERPYDLLYTIECWSRYRAVAIMLLQMILARYPIFGSVKLTDSLGCVRTYKTIQSGIADLTEVNSLVDRVCGYSVTIRAEAELTLDRIPEFQTAFTGNQTTTPPLGPPAQGPNPDLPPGGIYGDGYATTRVTVKEG